MTLFTPELVLVILALALLMVDAFLPKLPKRYIGYLATLGLAWAFRESYHLGDTLNTPDSLHPLWEGFSRSGAMVFVARSIILVSGILTLIMLIDFRSVVSQFVTGDRRNQDGTGELFILPLFATAGMLWMCSASNFISLFVSLELTTLTCYIMVGYLRRNVGSLEGGVKYLITGALSAGIFIFGVAWLYGTTGTFAIGPELVTAIEKVGLSPAVIFALALVLLGILFKIAAVPMHIWAPDVYQGAPTPVTAFLSVASKMAGLCVLVSFLVPLWGLNIPHLPLVMTIIAVATLIVGNLGAMGQINLKRLLGYSSIANAGYLLPLFLLPVGAASLNSTVADEGVTGSIALYMICYLPMTFGAFYVLSLIREQVGTEDLNSLKGLARRNPRLAAVTTLMFASLAGVPLTGGFVAKFSALLIMARSEQWVVFSVAIIVAVTGFYYYFKPIRAMYWEKADESTPVIKVPVLSGIILAILSLVVILEGLFIFYAF